MSTNTHRPTLDEFLVAPLATVREVAPATVIVATGGTRRRAMLDGIDIRSEAYPQQTRIHMIDAIELLLAYGAQHVFVPILVDGNFNEETPDYRDHLFRWIADGIAGPTAIDDYAQREWQVRLVGAEEDSPLWATATKLIAATVSSTARCVWFTVAPSSTHAWEFALRKIVAAQATTHAAAVKAVYGQEIPVDGALLLDFGKPQIFTSAVPPLLICKLHCYWRQSLGYQITEELLRRVIYDYAYNRRTWQIDKSARTDAIFEYADWYARPPILGEGERLGPFWFPKPWSGPGDETPA